MAQKGEPETTTAPCKFMSIVTDDLLSEILVRLPNSKSVIQCSTVCKSWFSLIFHSNFITNFIHHHQNKTPSSSGGPKNLSFYVPYPSRSLPQLLSEKTDNILYGIISSRLSQELPQELRTTLHVDPKFGYIKASYNDLLLLSYPTKEEDFKEEYYIFNPLTKQWLPLPKPPIDGYALWIGLVFEHNICNKRQLGCDCSMRSSSRFRVLFVTYFSDIIIPMIFCSETGEWSGLILPFEFEFGLIHPEVFASNGIFYLLEQKKKRGLIAFDPFKDTNHSKRCCFFDLPEQEGGQHHELVQELLGVVQNRVRLAQRFKVHNSVNVYGFTFVLKVWEFNCDNGGGSRPADYWRLVHNVIGEMAKTTIMFVEAFHPNNGDLIFLLTDHGFYRYDIKGVKYEKVQMSEVPHLGRHDITFAHPVWPSSIPNLSNV